MSILLNALLPINTCPMENVGYPLHGVFINLAPSLRAAASVAHHDVLYIKSF